VKPNNISHPALGFALLGPTCFVSLDASRSRAARSYNIAATSFPIFSGASAEA
jgi:hypothetical protein